MSSIATTIERHFDDKEKNQRRKEKVRSSDAETSAKKLDIFARRCVVRNRMAGLLVKRLGIEEGIELNPPLFDLFLKNDAMHDPMVNDSYCETFGWVRRESGTDARADLQSQRRAEKTVR